MITVGKLWPFLPLSNQIFTCCYKNSNVAINYFPFNLNADENLDSAFIISFV
jgi:hypothetical protein